MKLKISKCYGVADTVLSRVRDVDPNDSEAVKEAVGAFFLSLPKYKDVGCTQFLRALKDVINRYVT